MSAPHVEATRRQLARELRREVIDVLAARTAEHREEFA